MQKKKRDPYDAWFIATLQEVMDEAMKKVHIDESINPIRDWNEEEPARRFKKSKKQRVDDPF